MKINVKSNDNLVQFHNLNLGDCFRNTDACGPIYIKIYPAHVHMHEGEELSFNAVDLEAGTLEYFKEFDPIEYCPDATVTI